MMKGIGNDIIEIERIRHSLEQHGDHFCERVFTPKERAYCLEHADPAPRFAGRFSAKEAVVKALGCGFGKDASWQDIEILSDPNGKPEVHLSDSLMKRFNNPRILLSISHCKLYATAVAIWHG